MNDEGEWAKGAMWASVQAPVCRLAGESHSKPLMEQMEK